MNQNKWSGECCIICEEIKEEGIHLYTSFICMECERDMVSTETNEISYSYYVTKLRKVTSSQIPS
ncbi:carnitine--CoA ligase [Bacillus coahuilensis m2-6]|uniref:Carnitine--CoA ligase n=1 Tax=Bacillus coahuilensis p1.1.43 TaxID=1150625 RepID=A0A147K4X3_9BACI|nr:sigma factor G inhibitor Gin [Bacillus coahuilensis]KUP04243.1 carnitine--CoA ligase [Bacillus coahuilensis m2-6]KUP04582.1 carnitine--CoA ligase [Bacillus coahuilensis p1.1.43]